MKSWPSAIQPWAIGLSAVLLLAELGCTKRNAPPTQQEAHLKALAVCYGRFIGQHQGNPPKSEEEFKGFIEKIPREQIPGTPTDLNSLFVSPRDNLPYGVRYDLDRSQMTPGPNMPIVAYEQQGQNGRRYIANLVGAVQEVDEARFREIAPDIANASTSGATTTP